MVPITWAVNEVEITTMTIANSITFFMCWR